MKILSIAILILCCFEVSKAQNLTFTRPINFLSSARTDKAIDINNFKGGYFVTWKNAGATGSIHVCYLGRQYDTTFSQNEVTIGDEKSAFAPVLRSAGKHIYVLWLDENGELKYVINNSDTSFNTQKIYTVSFSNPSKLTPGITAAVSNGHIMIGTHTANKNEMAVAMLEADDNGILKPTTLQPATGMKSTEYAFIIALTDNSARICFKDASDQGIYYADFNFSTQAWSKQVAICNAKSTVSPAVYHPFGASRLFYIWKGGKKDDHIYYATEDEQTHPVNENILPDYFKTPYPVSICNVDDKKFIVTFIGADQKFYLSYFRNYNPANWMGDVLFPTKGNLTLKDIVIPGSHDAGMSALNGTGGTQASSINPCNTLTQKQNIGKQLNAGIRMFDLRVGLFNNAIYTKHSSSDCMADAVGGGYGERFKDILDSIKTFLDQHKKEFIILTFSHFCPKEVSPEHLADSIINVLGKEHIYNNESKNIGAIKLNELADKVIVTFEQYANRYQQIDSSSIADKSKTFLNFRRAYAATNQIGKLLAREQLFFTAIKNGVNQNDLVRLDWQLTQSSDEAALVCNDFQDEKINPVLNGMMLLTNVIKNNRSITDLAVFGNKYLPSKVNEWIGNGIINKNNKPNILYVDVAGAWITDYCINLNSNQIYN